MGASDTVCCTYLSSLPGKVSLPVLKTGKHGSVLSGQSVQHIEHTHVFHSYGVVVFQHFFSLYCDNHPVRLLRTLHHRYFTLGSANHVLQRCFPSLCHPIGERAFARGGADEAVNHSEEAGRGSQKELGYRGATQQDKQQRSAKTTFTHPHPTSTGG